MSDFKLVEVTWGDAWHAQGWTSLEEVTDGDVAPCVVTSVGYLIKDTPEGVILSPDYIPEESEIYGLSFIPRGMIIEVVHVSGSGGTLHVL